MKKWIAYLNDQSIVSSDECVWKNIEDKVTSIYFINDDQKITLPKEMDKYGQATTASASLLGGGVHIESRYIYFEKNGLKIIVRIGEKTGDIQIECEEAK